MENTLGSLLENARKRKNISRFVLAKGLCTEMSLSRYESGIRIPDKFLADALLERLGLNPYRFEFITSKKEFDYWMQRDKIEKLLWFEKYEEANEAIKEYQASVKARDKLHMQYVQIAAAQVLCSQAKKQEEKKCLCNALESTKAMEFVEGNQVTLLSNLEIKACCMLAENFYDTGEKENAFYVYSKLKKYMHREEKSEEVLGIDLNDDRRKEDNPLRLFRLSEEKELAYNWGEALHFLEEAEKLIRQEYKINLLYDILKNKERIQRQINKLEKTGQNMNGKKNECNIEFSEALNMIRKSNYGILTEESIGIWESIAKHPL